MASPRPSLASLALVVSNGLLTRPWGLKKPVNLGTDRHFSILRSCFEHRELIARAWNYKRSNSARRQKNTALEARARGEPVRHRMQAPSRWHVESKFPLKQARAQGQIESNSLVLVEPPTIFMAEAACVSPPIYDAAARYMAGPSFGHSAMDLLKRSVKEWTAREGRCAAEAALLTLHLQARRPRVVCGADS